jgi:hypothetical protein
MSSNGIDYVFKASHGKVTDIILDVEGCNGLSIY